jgi:hypothetical protein
MTAVRSRTCVDAWAGAASCGSFLTVAQVAICGLGLLLRESLVDYGITPNNAYSQGGQELSASAGACSPGLLADTQGQAVVCPPRTLLYVPG